MLRVPPADASFREACRRAPRRVAQAIEPSGEGDYVEAVRDWIDQATPSGNPAPLRLVR